MLTAADHHVGSIVRRGVPHRVAGGIVLPGMPDRVAGGIVLPGVPHRVAVRGPRRARRHVGRGYFRW